MEKRKFKRVIVWLLAVMMMFSSIEAAAASPSLKYGSKGTQVKQLQLDLIKVGYKIAGAPSTFFGKNTETALKKFQKSAKLKTTGVYDSKTKTALLKKKSSLSQKQKYPPGFSRTLKKGSRGADVGKLQGYLVKAGYKLKADQIFGSQTYNAVISFQEKKKVKTTGIADAKTIELIIKETKPKAPKPVYPAGFSRTLTKGMSGTDVGKLQTYLVKLGYAIKVDKSFTSQTYNALLSFQKKNKLMANGKADDKTLNAVAKAANALDKPAAPSKPKPQTPAPGKPPIKDKPTPTVPVDYPKGFTRTLQLGHKGSDVRLLQAYLTKAGYRVGVDEVFGQETQTAIFKFQQTEKLPSSGLADQETLVSIVQKATDSPAYKGYSFSGKGYGHAVGMPQWGALGMAQKGYRYHDILKYYYTGVDFKTIDTSKQDIRVGLSLDKASVDVRGTGKYTIQDLNGKVLFEPLAGSTTTITVEKGKLKLSGLKETLLLNQPVKAVPEKGQYLYHKGFKYNGVLGFSLSANQRVDVINTLNIETYLQGVVPAEISSKWHPEAIKAQTLAARTYALKHLTPKSKYDVVDTVMSQVYYGMNVEAANVNSIINGETKGEVIVYNGVLINAFFSASSGGHTVGSGFVWSTDLPYLVGKPDPFDQSKYASNWWTYEVNFREISNKAASLNIGEVVDIKVVETKYTRPVKVRITGFKGTAYVSGSQFRSLISNEQMKSAIYTAQLLKN